MGAQAWEAKRSVGTLRAGEPTSGHLLRRLRGSTMEHSMDTDVLIDIWPVRTNSVADQAIVVPLLRGGL